MEQQLLWKVLAVAGETLKHDSGKADATVLIEAAGYLTEFENDCSAYTLTITPNATRRTEAQAQHDLEAQAYRLGQIHALEAARNAVKGITIEPYSAADMGE